MRTKTWVVAAMLACSSASGWSQMGGSGGMTQGAAVDPAKAQSKLLDLFETEVMGVAKAMPADKYGFAPASTMLPGSKFDGVRSFAQEATHIAQANYFFFSGFGAGKPDADVKAIGSLTSKDQIVAALQASFAYAHKAIATITPANAYTAIKDVDGMDTRATVASFAVAHGYDHYGQMVEYLRMNGVVPPGSK